MTDEPDEATRLSRRTAPDDATRLVAPRRAQGSGDDDPESTRIARRRGAGPPPDDEPTRIVRRTAATPPGADDEPTRMVRRDPPPEDSTVLTRRAARARMSEPEEATRRARLGVDEGRPPSTAPDDQDDPDDVTRLGRRTASPDEATQLSRRGVDHPPASRPGAASVPSVADAVSEPERYAVRAPSTETHGPTPGAPVRAPVAAGDGGLAARTSRRRALRIRLIALVTGAAALTVGAAIGLVLLIAG